MQSCSVQFAINNVISLLPSCQPVVSISKLFKAHHLSELSFLAQNSVRDRNFLQPDILELITNIVSVLKQAA